MLTWLEGTESLAMEQLGAQYARYRLGTDNTGERAMCSSLERYGQLTPIVACADTDTESVEVLDGFKRCAAARALCWPSLRVRRVQAEERHRKAAIVGLNQGSGGLQELEEGWIIHALVREDGLSQLEVAELLGRHRSWVCRRLALVERLCPQAQEDVRLGVLRPTSARELVRLPAGNQGDVVAAAHREQLTRDEVRGVVELLTGCSNADQRQFVLGKPREALEQARGTTVAVRDPRLSTSGQRTLKRLRTLEQMMVSLRGWLGSGGHGELTSRDRDILRPAFLRVADAAETLSELARDAGAPG